MLIIPTMLLVTSLAGAADASPTPAPPIVFQCGSATPGDLTAFTLTIDTVAQSVNVYWPRVGAGRSFPATKITPSEIDWSMPEPGTQIAYDYSVNRQSARITFQGDGFSGSIQCK